MATKKSRAKSTKRKSTSHRSTRRPVKKSASAVSTSTNKNTNRSVDPGFWFLAALLIFVGLIGWYMLNESQEITDQYSDIEASSNVLIKQNDSGMQDASDVNLDVGEQ